MIEQNPDDGLPLIEPRPPLPFSNDKLSLEEKRRLRRCFKVIQSEKKASTSMLMRRLNLGYNQAAGAIDFFERKGIIGPEAGAKSRDILVDLDHFDLDALLSPEEPNAASNAAWTKKACDVFYCDDSYSPAAKEAARKMRKSWRLVRLFRRIIFWALLVILVANDHWVAGIFFWVADSCLTVLIGINESLQFNQVRRVLKGLK